MGNGAYGQCGHRGKWGTGDMGYMGNEADRGKVIHGVWGVEVWATWSIGHMANGAHGQWGPITHIPVPHCPCTPLPM